VFSHAHGPHDFPALLPKLYRRGAFMDGIHYVAREDGRIKAVVGAYPLFMDVRGMAVPGRGIGMVSVHPYCRRRGFMKALMGAALEDMKRDGVVFSCLGGQRQRYEYFGYTPAGTVCRFDCSADNIRHTLGVNFRADFSLKQLEWRDTELIEQIRHIHLGKAAYMERSQGKFFDIITSWKGLAFAIMEGKGTKQRARGYLLCSSNEREIPEINLDDHSRLAEVVGLFLQRRNGGGGEVSVAAQSHETEKIAALSRFAQSYRQCTAYNFAVFDYCRFILPFMMLKSSYRTLPNGSFTLRIEDGPALTLAASGGDVSVTETRGKAGLNMSRQEAVRFLFAPESAAGSPVIGASPFLQSLLPLPLSIEKADQV
jgi:predicted N-acetyltransferase YhbS